MNVSELRAIEEPILAVSPEELPEVLADRARAYNIAVGAFHDAVRLALASLEQGIPVDGETASGLRAAAEGLVLARDWLLDLAGFPRASRVDRP